MPIATLGPFDFGKIVDAIQRVEERLYRATTALNHAGIPYAVIGGNAVANWVSRMNPSAVRFTKDVDLLIQRNDLAAMIPALEQSGFKYRHAAGIDFFLDDNGGKFEDAVHVVFANERVRAEYAIPAPSVAEAEMGRDYRVLALEALVRMKLTSFRLKDQVHLQDLVQVGLIDLSWPSRYPALLAERLQQILDNPNA
ncbi:hypothetical protein GC163_07505 [bacterium]|nr:hypothetical protein [bacterium]